MVNSNTDEANRSRNNNLSNNNHMNKIFSILIAVIVIAVVYVYSTIPTYNTYDNGIAMLNAKDSTLSEILRIQDKHRTDNFDRWKSCLEASDYSDSECEQCDYLYNKSGKFDLSKYNSANGSINIEDVSFIQWETCIKIALDNGTNCNACDVYNPKGLDFQTDLLH